MRSCQFTPAWHLIIITNICKNIICIYKHIILIYHEKRPSLTHYNVINVIITILENFVLQKHNLCINTMLE